MNTETIVTEIFQDVLGVENIDKNDSFLNIGGNSLNLVEIMTQIKDKIGIEPKARLFFDTEQSTILNISNEIDLMKNMGS